MYVLKNIFKNYSTSCRVIAKKKNSMKTSKNSIVEQTQIMYKLNDSHKTIKEHDFRFFENEIAEENILRFIK